MTSWPKCSECGITTRDLLAGKCVDPRRCALVVLQRAAVVAEQVRAARARVLLASAQLLALFGRNTPQEEFELARVAHA